MFSYSETGISNEKLHLGFMPLMLEMFVLQISILLSLTVM